MTKKTFIFAFATIAVLSLAAMAVAGPGYGRGGGCPGWGGANAVQQLSPEQQEQAQALFDEYEQAVIPLREKIFAKHALLNAELESAQPDDAKIGALTKDLGELKTRLFAERVELRKKLAAAGIPAMGRGYGRGNAPCAAGPANCPGATTSPCGAGAPCGQQQAPCGGAGNCPGYDG